MWVAGHSFPLHITHLFSLVRYHLAVCVSVPLRSYLDCLWTHRRAALRCLAQAQTLFVWQSGSVSDTSVQCWTSTGSLSPQASLQCSFSCAPVSNETLKVHTPDEAWRKMLGHALVTRSGMRSLTESQNFFSQPVAHFTLPKYLWFRLFPRALTQLSYVGFCVFQPDWAHTQVGKNLPEWCGVVDFISVLFKLLTSITNGCEADNIIHPDSGSLFQLCTEIFHR